RNKSAGCIVKRQSETYRHLAAGTGFGTHQGKAAGSARRLSDPAPETTTAGRFQIFLLLRLKTDLPDQGDISIVAFLPAVFIINIYLVKINAHRLFFSVEVTVPAPSVCPVRFKNGMPPPIVNSHFKGRYAF